MYQENSKLEEFVCLNLERFRYLWRLRLLERLLDFPCNYTVLGLGTVLGVFRRWQGSFHTFRWPLCSNHGFTLVLRCASNKKPLVTKVIATRRKDATSSSWHYYE